MMTRTFQSRLGSFQDRIRRKLVDNTISLTGDAADCIRVQLKKDKRSGDILTRIVENADVVSVVFPVLKDVPYRRLYKENGLLRVDTLPAAIELFPLQVTIPHNQNIYIDDLIFRIIKDQPDTEYYDSDLDYQLTDCGDMTPGKHDKAVASPIILCLQITECLGTFGQGSLIWSKYNCVYYNETLPTEMLETINELSNRRLALGW